MKMEVEANNITIPFSDLAESETYREESNGIVYMKLFGPIEERYGGKYNAIDIKHANLVYTFEDADVFPVNGTFVEGYKKG